MEISDIYLQLAVALAIGTLIGIERGWHERDNPEGTRVAGVRTFALIGLLGGIFGLLTRGQGAIGLLALVVVFVVVTITVAAFRYREAASAGDFGTTTVVAAMLTFALGAFTVLGDTVAAAAFGVGVAGILASKAALHEWVKRITWQELRASLVLLAMTVILYPILPEQMSGFFGTLNPRELWLMTIMIAALSFVGYLAIKIAGERTGILLSGLAGGLVSSTVTTMNMSRLAKAHPDRERLFAGGTVFAGAIMVFRVLVIVGVFNPLLMRWLAPPLLLAGTTMVCSGVFLMRRGDAETDHEPLSLRNPFNLKSVLGFGALLAFVMVVVDAAAGRVGETGILTVAAVSGLADIDAISLSLARLGRSQLATGSTALAILVAVLANTVSKVGLAWFIGGARQGLRLLLTALAAAAMGYLGYLLGELLYWHPN
ncbi:MgtC/SapB family protein [Hoeflea sp. TYP-13]|uniref:MgtC/SapB family protein n=1 Tax=Hoeflea sp. TYP-13 TaxID=3230023 RepID=UPI0034C63427